MFLKLNGHLEKIGFRLDPVSTLVYFSWILCIIFSLDIGFMEPLQLCCTALRYTIYLTIFPKIPVSLALGTLWSRRFCFIWCTTFGLLKLRCTCYLLVILPDIMSPFHHIILPDFHLTHVLISVSCKSQTESGLFNHKNITNTVSTHVLIVICQCLHGMLLS